MDILEFVKKSEQNPPKIKLNINKNNKNLINNGGIAILIKGKAALTLNFSRSNRLEHYPIACYLVSCALHQF